MSFKTGIPYGSRMHHVLKLTSSRSKTACTCNRPVIMSGEHDIPSYTDKVNQPASARLTLAPKAESRALEESPQ